MVYTGRDYVGIEEILLDVVYTCIQCHPLNMLQSFIAIFGQLPLWRNVQFDLVQLEITHITLFIQLLRCLSLAPQ